MVAGLCTHSTLLLPSSQSRTHPLEALFIDSSKGHPGSNVPSFLLPKWYVVACLSIAVLVIICVASAFSSNARHQATFVRTSGHLHPVPQSLRPLTLKPLRAREEYINPGAQALSTFITKENGPKAVDAIDWNVPKRRKTSLSQLAKDLEKSLLEREWFVTGNVDPSFFSDDFRFQDPDVRIEGIKGYAQGVNKIFTQGRSRAEVIAVQVNRTLPNTLTVTWRLSGGVNIGFGLTIKPYIVYTNFEVSPVTGLIVFQQDEQGLPGYDIVLSAFFPFLVSEKGGLLAPPAPPADVLREQFRQRFPRATDSIVDGMRERLSGFLSQMFQGRGF